MEFGDCMFVEVRCRKLVVLDLSPDAKGWKNYTLLPGRYELERIAHPNGFLSACLVVKGTLYGMAEVAWRNNYPDRVFFEEPLLAI